MSIGKEGKEQWEGKRREGNAQTWKEGDSCESQTPLTASGRERGKGKAGREKREGNGGKGTLLDETCNKHRTDLKHICETFVGCMH